jgi:hypothetical protein
MGAGTSGGAWGQAHLHLWDAACVRQGITNPPGCCEGSITQASTEGCPGPSANGINESNGSKRRRAEGDQPKRTIATTQNHRKSPYTAETQLTTKAATTLHPSCTRPSHPRGPLLPPPNRPSSAVVPAASPPSQQRRHPSSAASSPASPDPTPPSGQRLCAMPGHPVHGHQATFLWCPNAHVLLCAGLVGAPLVHGCPVVST